MVQINFALKEVNCKVVFYGPGMSGKTTNLEIVHQKAPEENKGDLTSISTDGDRTLFFDFMPLDLGNIAGMRTKFQLYTVPGQVYYNSTRKLVLQGVDGIIFVADSAPDKLEETIESYHNLEENLREYGKELSDLPHVIQWNKRDLPNALPIEELERKVNKFGVPTFEAVAVTGEGVFPTLKVLASMVLETINKTDRSGSRQARPAAGPSTPPAPKKTQPAAQQAPRGSAQPQPRGQAPARSAARGQTRTQVRPTQASEPQRAVRSTRGKAQPARPGVRRPARPQEPQGAKRSPHSGLFAALLFFLALAAAGAGYVLFFMNQ